MGKCTWEAGCVYTVIICSDGGCSLARRLEGIRHRFEAKAFAGERAGELLVLGITLLATGGIWLLCFNQLHAVSISPSLARSKGIPVRFLDNLFVVLIAVIVMLAIQWVGLLIINAMLILPAAASRNVARSMRSYHLLALIFGLFSGLLGLLFSCHNAVAAGPTVVLIAAALYFGTFALREKEA